MATKKILPFLFPSFLRVSEMQASIQSAASTMIQLIPVKFESNHNTLNRLKWLASTSRFGSFHSNIVVLKNSLGLHLSGLNVLTACFGGKFLNRTCTGMGAKQLFNFCWKYQQMAARATRKQRRGDLASKIITRAEKTTGAPSDTPGTPTSTALA